MEKLYSRICSVLDIFRPMNDVAEGMERFLESKNIQSVSEVEYWMREYERLSTQTIELE